MARKDATRRSKVPAEVSPQHADKQEQDGGAAQQQASGEKGGPCRAGASCATATAAVPCKAAL